MERLRQVFASISASIAALSPIGRLAIFLVVAVIVLSLGMVALMSGRGSYVPALVGASPEQQQAAASTAAMYGIPSEMKNGVLMVPAEKRDYLHGLIVETGKLTDDSTVLFSNLSSKQNWMAARPENERIANLALQNELARVIKNFPSVQDARVFLEAPEPVGLGAAYRKPTAAVSVWSKAGKSLNQGLVDAIGALVAGAKAGLSANDVRVIDGSSGRQFRTKSDMDLGASDYMEHVAKIEDRLQGKLLDTLRYISGVIVAVNAQADVRKTSVSETRMLPDKAGSVAIPSRTTNKETQSAGGSSGTDAGPRSNVSDDIAKGGNTGSKQSDTTEDTEFKVGLGSRREDTVDPRGMPTKLNVTINVPREYVQDLIRLEKKLTEKDDISQADIDTKFAAEKTRLESDLKPLVETVATAAGGALATQAGMVVVSMIPVRSDGAGIAKFGGSGGTGGGGGGGGGSSGVMGEVMAGGLIKNVALGLISVVALGMMLMLVRKAAKPVDLPTAQEIVGLPPALEAGADVVGEADEGATAMEGVELGDDQLKVKKMLETIGDLVKNKPGDAASLLNRWLQAEP